MVAGFTVGAGSDAAGQGAAMALGLQDRFSFGQMMFEGGMGAALQYLMRACFRRGTPIVTDLAGRAKPVETFRRDDFVLSRNEFDPNGPLALKRVLEVFATLGRVTEVRVRDRIIGTTAEHPFFVVNRGTFVPAGQLEIGDVFLSDDRQVVVVEGVKDTGKYETVYNLSVEDFHTYFVGSSEWGFSVWAHNACVYNSLEKDIERYIGIADTGKTVTLGRRLAAAFARTPAAISNAISSTIGVSKTAVQQIEQALIHYFGRVGKEAGGTLVNSYRGVNISDANISAGYKLLSSMNFWSGRRFPVHINGSGI